MNRKQTLSRFTAIAALSAAGLAALPIALPLGASFFAPQVAFADSCFSNPNETNCNYQDPGATGCNGATITQILASAPITNVGSVYVMYSTQCQTKWARVNNNLGGAQVTALTSRADGLYNTRQISGGPTRVEGPMLYAPRNYQCSTHQVYGQGYINGNANTNYTGYVC